MYKICRIQNVGTTHSLVTSKAKQIQLSLEYMSVMFINSYCTISVIPCLLCSAYKSCIYMHMPVLFCYIYKILYLCVVKVCVVMLCGEGVCCNVVW